MILAVDHYVTGTARTYVLRQQAIQETGISDDEFWAAQEPTLIQAMDSGNYPGDLSTTRRRVQYRR
ncbi:MAG: hypothetical protein ACRDTT_22405 [Pseudonocardiaceae bacterium]